MRFILCRSGGDSTVISATLARSVGAARAVNRAAIGVIVREESKVAEPRFYFVTLRWGHVGNEGWIFQNDILDVHPLAYLRGNEEASERAVKAFEDSESGKGPWEPPAFPEEYVLAFWSEITREEYDAHKTWQER